MSTTTNAATENEELNEKLAQVVKHLAEFELNLARQNALSDQIDTLTKQFVEFEHDKKAFFMLLPFMNHTLNEFAEFNKDDLNITEINLKLKLVIII